MSAGAYGMSTGLVYPPGCYAATAEVVELARVVARHHGIYTSHIRGERETIREAIAEAIEIGRAAGVPVEVSHNAPKFGATEDASATLGMVEEARARGLDVTVDNDVHTDLAPRLSRALPQPVLDARLPGAHGAAARYQRTAWTAARRRARTCCPAPGTPDCSSITASTAS